MADFDTPYINELINQFGQLPGIGKKTAQRLAFHILSQPEEKSQGLARAILNACENIHLCNICCNLSDRETCDICTDESRDQSVICVVEKPFRCGRYGANPRISRSLSRFARCHFAHARRRTRNNCIYGNY